MIDDWYLEAGVIIEDLLSDYNNLIVINKDKTNIPELNGSHRLRGCPFDNITPWAEEIEFNRDGWFWLISTKHSIIKRSELICFNKCPVKWKKGIYKITERLKELILC